MARTGTPTIIRLVRKICSVAAIYGASDLQARTTPEYAAAITALRSACAAFEALDDQPGERDNTGPLFSGDNDGPPL